MVVEFSILPKTREPTHGELFAPEHTNFSTFALDLIIINVFISLAYNARFAFFSGGGSVCRCRQLRHNNYCMSPHSLPPLRRVASNLGAGAGPTCLVEKRWGSKSLVPGN